MNQRQRLESATWSGSRHSTGRSCSGRTASPSRNSLTWQRWRFLTAPLSPGLPFPPSSWPHRYSFPNERQDDSLGHPQPQVEERGRAYRKTQSVGSHSEPRGTQEMSTFPVDGALQERGRLRRLQARDVRRRRARCHWQIGTYPHLRFRQSQRPARSMVSDSASIPTPRRCHRPRPAT